MQSQENGENGHRADRRSDAAAQSGGVDGVGAIDAKRRVERPRSSTQGDPEVIDNSSIRTSGSLRASRRSCPGAGGPVQDAAAVEALEKRRLPRLVRLGCTNP